MSNLMFMKMIYRHMREIREIKKDIVLII